MKLGAVSGPPACSLPPIPVTRCSIGHIKLLQCLPNGSRGGSLLSRGKKRLGRRYPSLASARCKPQKEEVL